MIADDLMKMRKRRDDWCSETRDPMEQKDLWKGRPTISTSCANREKETENKERKKKKKRCRSQSQTIRILQWISIRYLGMAMVLESAAIPRESTIPGDQLRARLALPKCTAGFRVEFPTKSRSPITPARHLYHSSRAARSIVCEQRQETIRPAGEVNDETWEKIVLDSDVPVLVDFWAPWCGPCRMIAPIVDELAVEYAGKVRCVKLNTDESPNTATKYGIRSIPTVMIFKGGEKKDSIIGAVPKGTLVSCIEKFL